jgi:hypothetical protein
MLHRNPLREAPSFDEPLVPTEMDHHDDRKARRIEIVRYRPASARACS